MNNHKNNSKFRRYLHQEKNTHSSRIIQSIRNLFLSGGKYTAKDINPLWPTNGARKLISYLRHEEGRNITDCRLPNGCKLYWLAGKEGGGN